MAVNIEIKAHAADVSHQQALATKAADGRPEMLVQEDTFFQAKAGRLKMRIEGSSGHLVDYERGSATEPRPSQYQIVHTSDPQALKAMLAQALGVLGVVRKRRLLYRVDQARVHFDEVEGLGRFIEIEVLVTRERTADEAHAVARGLMTRLKIEPRHLIAEAYLDLLHTSRQS